MGVKAVQRYALLKAIRALLLYKVYCISALLVLNGPSLNSINTFLALNQQKVIDGKYKFVMISI